MTALPKLARQSTPERPHDGRGAAAAAAACEALIALVPETGEAVPITAGS
jgi:hypothetical protein